MRSHRIHVRDMLFYGTVAARRRTDVRDGLGRSQDHAVALLIRAGDIRLSTTRRLSPAARPTSTKKTTRPSSARQPSSTRAPVLGSSATTSPSTASRRGARTRSTTRPGGRSSPTTRCCTTATRPGISAGRGSHHCHHNLVIGCVEIKILRRVRAESSTSSSTPSTRRLLDGVAMPVPRRSPEPGRPRHRREMT